ncbi:MAG: hypothetical protein DMG54_01880 [Acidobacteria bacterium]|nr:MAG: hypothetical protein DMG54_01880 [Acidobacteriota bacterium]
MAFNSSEKQKHWTQADLASHVGVNRECLNAIEKGRFLPSIALAYNIAAALKYMSTRFSQPRAQLRVRCPNCPAPTTSSVPQPRVSPHLNRET